MTIFIDMDETLNEFGKQYIKYLKEIVSTPIDKDLSEQKKLSMTSYLLEDYSVSDQIMYRDIVFNKSGFWLGMETKPDVIKSMQILCSVHEVYIVTKPAVNALNSWLEKAQWVKNNFPFFPMSNLIMTNNKGLLHGDIIIDDDPINLQSPFIEKKAIFDMPYNQECEADYRFNNWEEIVKTLLWK